MQIMIGVKHILCTRSKGNLPAVKMQKILSMVRVKIDVFYTLIWAAMGIVAEKYYESFFYHCEQCQSYLCIGRTQQQRSLPIS